ncbi:hypothetical protein LTR62_008837 [Meristemomyces frigidus]|uniref:Uncharacterized protein n=1 Tax=Meristemomyces frigidus TaxID=1508187 RepID=A0AAN7YGX6_9PEZI|nr:hypothetical protein LTR62_008837 [Meristemomyces frigidus]
MVDRATIVNALLGFFERPGVMGMHAIQEDESATAEIRDEAVETIPEAAGGTAQLGRFDGSEREHLQGWRQEFKAQIKHLQQCKKPHTERQRLAVRTITAHDLEGIDIPQVVAQHMLVDGSDDPENVMVRLLKRAAAGLPFGSGMGTEEALAAARGCAVVFEHHINPDRRQQLECSDLSHSLLAQAEILQAHFIGTLSDLTASTDFFLPDAEPLDVHSWMRDFIMRVNAVRPLESNLDCEARCSIDLISVADLKRRLPLLERLAQLLLLYAMPWAPAAVQRVLEAVMWRPDSRLDSTLVAIALRQLVLNLQLVKMVFPEWHPAEEAHAWLNSTYEKCMQQAETSTSPRHPKAFLPPAVAMLVLDGAPKYYVGTMVMAMLHDIVSGLRPSAVSLEYRCVDQYLHHHH